MHLNKGLEVVFDKAKPQAAVGGMEIGFAEEKGFRYSGLKPLPGVDFGLFMKTLFGGS
jgi:hypothetical protein